MTYEASICETCCTPEAVGVEDVAAGQLLVAAGGHHLLAADDADAVTAGQVLLGRMASGKRSSMLAVTRRYRRKSVTRLRKLRKVQYRSRSCAASEEDLNFDDRGTACLSSCRTAVAQAGMTVNAHAAATE